MLAVQQALKGLKQQVQTQDNGSNSSRKSGRQEPPPTWGPLEWFSAFEILFTSGASVFASNDDMLFFVWSENQPNNKKPSSKNNNNISTKSPLFVRRTTHQIPEDLHPGGTKFNSIDWRKTTLLNAVVHAGYYLVVAVCGSEESRDWVAKGCRGDPPSDVMSVSQPVFASPSKVSMTLDDSKAADNEPEIAYPDICFTVDDFNTTFRDMVLKEPEHSYCVSLMAYPIKLPSDSIQNQQQIPAPVQDPSESFEVREVANIKNIAEEVKDEFKDPDEHDEFRSAASHLTTITQIQNQHSQFQEPIQRNYNSMDLDDEEGEGEANGGEKLQEVFQNQQAGDENLGGEVEKGDEEREMVSSRLFRGYVSCQQVMEVMQEDGELKPGQMSRKIKMHGPGRVGLAEVAVTQIVSKREIQEKKEKSKSGVVRLFGGGAKLLANIVLGYNAESVLDTQFRCCLMTLTVPVDELAKQILTNLY